MAVAGHLSHEDAATGFGCPRSSLDVSVSRLERAIGTSLVMGTPSSDRAELTDAGRLLLAHAEAVLARLHAARADLAARPVERPLRIGAYEAVVARVIPSIGERLTGLPIAIREAIDDAELLGEIEAGTLELAFAALPLPRGPFAWATLLDEPYVLVAPASWARRKGLDRLGIIELATSRLVGRRRSRSLADLEATLEARGHRLRIVTRAPSDAAVYALVRKGAGAAILPRLSVDANDPATVAIRLRALPPRTLALVWHRYRHLPRGVESFRAAALAVGEQLAAQVVAEPQA